LLEFVVRHNLLAHEAELKKHVAALIDVLGHGPMTNTLSQLVEYVVCRWSYCDARVCRQLAAPDVQALKQTCAQFQDIRNALELIPRKHKHKFDLENLTLTEADRMESALERIKDVLMSEADRLKIVLEKEKIDAVSMATAIFKCGVLADS
jgi:hypothetical protein